MALTTRLWSKPGRTGLSFTELGFGSAPLANLFRAISDQEADATLAAAWTGGVRYFDTAPLYGLGLAETRLNRFLRGKPRDAYVLSTKIGRLLRPCAPQDRNGIGKWFEVPNRREVFDYSYDGVMRSLEFSLERLGIDRVDILYAHDLDIFTHGSKAASDARIAEFFDLGGYRAMASLRDQGVVRAIGAGVNEWLVCQTLAERGDMDLFLLAGRYTLLEQDAVSTFLPLCQQRGIGVVVGGPYNSGILATGAVAGAMYNYDLAPAAVMAKVALIEATCKTHGVKLIEAAFAFPLAHPAVVSMIPGGQSLAQMAGNLAVAAAKVPPALWADLKAKGLLSKDAPTP